MDGVFGHYIAPRDRFFEEGDSFFHVGFTHASAVNVAVSKVADSLGVAEVGGFFGDGARHMPLFGSKLYIISLIFGC